MYTLLLDDARFPSFLLLLLRMKKTNGEEARTRRIKIYRWFERRRRAKREEEET